MFTTKRLLLILMAVALLGFAIFIILDNTLFAPVEASTDLPAAPTLDRALLPTSLPAARSTSTPQGQALAGTGGTPASTSESIPTLTAEPALPSSAAASGALYTIDPSQSEVRYEVGETFFQDNRFATAVGRTKGVSGEVFINFSNPSESQVGEIVINVSQLASDEGRRDNYLRRNALQSSTYPTASFTTRSADGLPDQAQVGQTYQFTITGDMTVREVTRTVSWRVSVTLEEDQLVGTAQTEVLMSDFGVGPVELAFLRTEDKARLVFDFVAVKK